MRSETASILVFDLNHNVTYLLICMLKDFVIRDLRSRKADFLRPSFNSILPFFHPRYKDCSISITRSVQRNPEAVLVNSFHLHLAHMELFDHPWVFRSLLRNRAIFDCTIVVIVMVLSALTRPATCISGL